MSQRIAAKIEELRARAMAAHIQGVGIEVNEKGGLGNAIINRAIEIYGYADELKALAEDKTETRSWEGR